MTVLRNLVVDMNSADVDHRGRIEIVQLELKKIKEQPMEGLHYMRHGQEGMPNSVFRW